MNISMSNPHKNKRFSFNNFPNCSVCLRKRIKPTILNSVSLYIKSLGIPLVSPNTDSSCNFIRLEPYKPCTIGRSSRGCDFIFDDQRVSKQHCQFLFDALNRKVCIVDGLFLSSGSGECCSKVRVSLNGVFVNGVRIGRGGVFELCAGDEVSLVCGNGVGCSSGVRIGFFVERLVFMEAAVDRCDFDCHFDDGFCFDHAIARPQGSLIGRVNLLVNWCRQIVCSDDPISLIKKSVSPYQEMRVSYARRNGCGNNSRLLSSNAFKFSVNGSKGLNFNASGCGKELLPKKASIIGQNFEIKRDSREHESYKQTLAVSGAITDQGNCDVNNELVQKVCNAAVPLDYTVSFDKFKSHFLDSKGREHISQCLPPPGSKFYLNHLDALDYGAPDDFPAVSLPELLYPVENLQRVFIATFTCDVLWFVSYCRIPAHLPVTIACHSAERCWNLSPDQRISLPLLDFPNIVLVYPPFPESIAFNNIRKRSGIACHHPKLFVLQRENSIRVIITSANLVAKQWLCVTNTVWWQDFPRASAPDYFSLFTYLSEGKINEDSNSDFAAQLAGFMASLVADVPSQAHWIVELTKYDFKGAVGHLVASVPGIYNHRTFYVLQSTHYLTDSLLAMPFCGLKLLGTVEASAVGLNYLFRTTADSNGTQLKKLAALLSKCHENIYGLSEIVLKRNRNIPADANAVSVFIFNPEEYFKGDCVQLGFLPRNVAKWVAPLSDSGLFAFSAYIYPKEVLATAMNGGNNRVQLILSVSQGPKFSDITEAISPELVSAMCVLVASIQRCTGLWRLQQVLSRYKWPEHLETDFIFGSSSVGAVNAQFLAAFSAAAGKRSLQFSESEESDPDWGCWSTSQELKNPSVRIVFPTVERIKCASSGILASRNILCFSQKTWERLRNVGMLHDAIPYPSNREGHPMHVKVARRRFKSEVDDTSCGWVYCGSHNFSAAAWGRPLYNSVGILASGQERANSVLGSRLHVCNYELGIIFIIPPSDASDCTSQKRQNLDDLTLPFVVPAPKYKPRDQPATAQAMQEAWLEFTREERDRNAEAIIAGDMMEEVIPDEEEEVLETPDNVTEEMEDEKAYAEILWVQVDSSQSS